METTVRYIVRYTSGRAAITCALAILASLFLTQPASAQAPLPDRRPLIFANLQVDAGTGGGLYGGLAGIFAGRHEVGLGYEAAFIRATQFPDDYNCPRCKHGFGNNTIAGAAATYGYAIYPGKSQRFLRFTLRGGILLGPQRVVANFVRVPNPAPREKNYTYDDEPRFGAALLLRPTADIAVNRNFGFALGPFAVLNTKLQVVGLTFGIRFGRVATDGLHYRLQARNRARAEMLRQQKR